MFFLRKLIIAIALVFMLGAGALTGVAFAHERTVSTTIFTACEDPTSGNLDSNSITQGTPVDCSADGLFTLSIQWSVTGPIGLTGPTGTNGVDGTPGATGPIGLTGPTGPVGPQGIPGAVGTQGPIGPIGLTGPGGPTGPTGPSGLPFSHAVCAETGLTGAARQENALFCTSGVAPDGGLIYTRSIAMANATHLVVGTPIASTPSFDWNGAAITYVEFTSGYHAEYHADNVVRFYNNLNHQVF
jgi:Collagen triple helix repeat (20 copies)